VYNGTGWVEVSTGGATAGVVDVMNAPAGENLAERDYAYLASDGEWYKVDIDATPVEISAIRGFVVETGGILATGTGTIRTGGVLGGFTGLSAGDDVYAHTTAGGYTQTKPTVAAAGVQKAIVRAGKATSTTEILIEPGHVEFAKRDSLANNATLTVEHFADVATKTRMISATVASLETGLVLTTYATSNQDVGVPLRGPSGAGGTESSGAQSGALLPVGNFGGTSYAQASTLTCTAGRLSQFTVDFGATVGTPTGTVTWEVQSVTSSVPSNTVLATGTFTPTASSTNTITITNGIFMLGGTSYAIVIKSTSAQSSDNYWQIVAKTSGTYANGARCYATSPYTSWTADAFDITFSLTTVAVSVGDKLSQGFQVAANDVAIVRLYLCKVGTPTGTMTLRIETDSAGSPSGTLVDAAATITLGEATLGTSYALVVFTLTGIFTAAGATTYHAVLSTDRSTSTSNYVLLGADASSPSYATGELKSQASSTWSAETKDACFTVEGPAIPYEEVATVGLWSGGTRTVAVRFDDGASPAADGDTKTTIKNVSGGALDITAIVRL
jgi:hypothetical protein